MRIKIIASGSKGNCTYIECGNKKFLIDMGINLLQLKNGLKEIDVSLDELSFILITHIHSDHTKGLATLLKKTNIVLYTSSGIYEELSRNIEINNYHVIDKEIMIDDVEILAFPLSHDVECYGYIIGHENKELVYITDTGYLNKRYIEILKNKDVYIIESNHDEKMLMEGPYPYIIKQRIISDKGHLSNTTTGKILNKVIGEKTKYIYLAHISEQNNLKVLAFDQVTSEIKSRNFNEKNIFVTDQYVSMEMIEV